MSDEENTPNDDFGFSLRLVETAEGKKQREARVAKRVYDGACPRCLQFKSEWKARPPVLTQEDIEKHNTEHPMTKDEAIKCLIDGLWAPRYTGDCPECGAPIWQGCVM